MIIQKNRDCCRFCKNTSILSLFVSSRFSINKQAAQFACTNCGFGIHGPIVKCGSCGIIYVDEEIEQKKISTYYEVAEDPLYFAEQKAREITFKNYLKKLEKVFPRKGKLLDVGTNTGLFVKLALENSWEALGIEPNKWAGEYAKKNYNIDIISKPFDKGVFEKESFDVITMWDVIEHFTNPISQMKNVFWYLKPGGVFVFSTIDPESLLARLMGAKWSWYMEMHRVFFTRKTAEFYLRKTGFNKIIFKSHFRNLSLGYLSTRLAAINPWVSNLTGNIIRYLRLSKFIVPYYANDLYDCYAFK